MCKSHGSFNQVELESILKQYNMDVATYEALRNGNFPEDNSNDELEGSVITDNQLS